MDENEPSLPTLINVWPSIEDAAPSEEGGPDARKGFNYQDEIAVGFLIQMLEDEQLCRVHCETHDDLVLVWSAENSITCFAEYVQVKAAEPDKLWSVPDVCRPKNGAGTSMFEISLGRDRHKETSRFRIVTLRPVVKDLEPLTFKCGSPGREMTGSAIASLRDELATRCPAAKSQKGNRHDFWLEHCLWEVRHDLTTVRNDNKRRLLLLSIKANAPLLNEQLDLILDDLRAWAKAAGDAKWIPDKAKKVIARATVREWWAKRLAEIASGPTTTSGGQLTAKMKAAALPDEVIALAIDLRRDYAAMVRGPRYMETEEIQTLQSRVKSEAVSLRSRHVAGQISLDGVGFHALCLERMDAINAERDVATNDRSAFLKGCLYDIADRCLMRFETSPP